jgi:putative phosphoesterase
MKYLVVSDIHGALDSTELILDVFVKKSVDKILLLGDVLYHGPRNDLPNSYFPKKVIERLNQYKDKILCIKGNCDAEVDQMVLDFPILKESALLINNTTFYLTHGHVHGPNNPINILKGVVLYGHTHVIKDEIINNVHYINPGSVSIPKEILIHSFVSIME